jgi:hypothetical protein
MYHGGPGKGSEAWRRRAGGRGGLQLAGVRGTCSWQVYGHDSAMACHAVLRQRKATRRQVHVGVCVKQRHERMHGKQHMATEGIPLQHGTHQCRPDQQAISVSSM